MKRYLPFVIILAVAALTAGGGALFYRAKMRALPRQAPPLAATPPAEKSELDGLHIRGTPGAPVVVEIFGDFQCPPCATVSGVIDKLEQDYRPRVRVIFREFPLAMHAHALEAALAAEAAGEQGRFWEMHDLLYQYQSVWSKASGVERFFEAYAGSLQLDVERFRVDSQSAEVRARVIAEGESGVSRGVTATPTLFVNGTLVRGAFTRENLKAVIEAALAGKKSS